MNKEDKFYDTHTLFCRTGPASEKQLVDYFEKITSNECKIHVNVIKNGIAYIYVESSRVYYMLLGKNPDGTDRIVYKECDQNKWTVSEGKVPTCLPSLIEIPPIVINDITYNVVIEKASVGRVNLFRLASTLKCCDVPEWVTNDRLKEMFSVYATDSITPRKRTNKGLVFYEAYPYINISSDRTAFIVFDPATRDAQFANYMVNGKILTNNNEEKVLVLEHSYKTERDMNKGYLTLSEIQRELPIGQLRTLTAIKVKRTRVLL